MTLLQLQDGTWTATGVYRGEHIVTRATSRKEARSAWLAEARDIHYEAYHEHENG